MSEVAKYYTPSIEEFHIGFELEAKVLLEENKCEWLPFTIKQPNYEWMNVHVNGDERTYSVPETVRVKYLDNEDIHNLGWEQGKLPYQFFDGVHMLIVLPHNGISITHIADEQCIFYGTIKNKSELKIIMKQLAVNNKCYEK